MLRILNVLIFETVKDRNIEVTAFSYFLLIILFLPQTIRKTRHLGQNLMKTGIQNWCFYLL